MSTLIENLRNQPEKEKNKFAMLLLIICAIVLFLLFGWVLKARFSNEETLNNIKDEVKPFQNLGEDLKGSFNNLDTQTQ